MGFGDERWNSAPSYTRHLIKSAPFALLFSRRDKLRGNFIFRRRQGSPCEKLLDCRATRSKGDVQQRVVVVYEEDREDGETGGRLPKVVIAPASDRGLTGWQKGCVLSCFIRVSSHQQPSTLSAPFTTHLHAASPHALDNGCRILPTCPSSCHDLILIQCSGLKDQITPRE